METDFGRHYWVKKVVDDYAKKAERAFVKVNPKTGEKIEEGNSMDEDFRSDSDIWLREKADEMSDNDWAERADRINRLLYESDALIARLESINRSIKRQLEGLPCKR